MILKCINSKVTTYIFKNKAYMSEADYLFSLMNRYSQENDSQGISSLKIEKYYVMSSLRKKPLFIQPYTPDQVLTKK